MYLLLVVGAGWLVLWALLQLREKMSGDAGAADQTRVAPDIMAGGVLFLLLLGFFWRTISGDVYQPADGGDLVSFLFPTYRFAAQQLSQGILPLWNPHLYGGAPFISDIQAGFLYPVNLLLFWLRPDFDYGMMQWLSLGHVYWAGLGVYVLLRAMEPGGRKVARLGALFGGLAFALSDALFIHLGNLNLIAVLSWLPWIFAAFVVALDRHSLRWSVLAALLFAVANYAGHAQSSYYIALALAVYAVTRAVIPRRAAETALLSRLAPLGHLAVVGLLTGLLTAPILLPAYEMTAFTERGDFLYQDTIAFSLAPTQALAGLVTPGFFGRGPALHWGLWDRVETPFVGVTTLLLALGALFVAPPRTRRELWPWVAVAVFGLVTALGVYAVFHGWLTVLLPGFDSFRAPARAIVLWAFAMSVLGGIGVDQVVRTFDAARVGDALLQETSGSGAGRGYVRLLGLGGLILGGVVVPLMYVALMLTQDDPTMFLRASVTALALVFAAVFWAATWGVIAALRAGWISGTAAGVLFVALLFFDYSSAGAYTDISSTDPARGFAHPELIEFLRSDPDLFRIDARTDIDDLWQPDTAALYGLYDVWGIANPLLLRHWDRLWEATGGRHTARYDMLNVKYVLVRDGTPLPEGKFELALDAPGELSLYRNRDFMPRAWLVRDAIAVAPGLFDAGDLSTVFDEAQMEPWERAVVETSSGLAYGGTMSDDEQVEVTGYDSSRMWLAVNTNAPALLILSEVWYPGWHARVNGVDMPVYRANGALRALQVPGGASTVELWFAPTTWHMGLWLALTGLVTAATIILVVTIMSLLTRRRKRHAAP